MRPHAPYTLLCVASLFSAGCENPPPRSQTQNCQVTSHSSSNTYQLDYQLLLPAPCPVPITQVKEIKTAAGRIIDNGLPDFDVAELVIRNSQGVVKGTVTDEFVTRNGVRSAAPRLDYEAGTGAMTISDRVPTNAYDYGRFQAFTYGPGQRDNPNNPYGTVEISYEKSAVNVSLSGPEIPPVNTSQTWYANPRDGVSPYQYRWYRNGVAVGTASSYSGDTGTEPFGLRVEVNDTHTAYAATVMAVDVGGVRATITGPTLVYASQNGGTWSVSGQGGQEPYTFRWYLDGEFSGEGPTWSGYPGENSHMLHVQMRDAAGAAHSATLRVQGLGSGDGTCDPAPPQLTCSP